MHALEASAANLPVGHSLLSIGLLCDIVGLLGKTFAACSTLGCTDGAAIPAWRATDQNPTRGVWSARPHVGALRREHTCGAASASRLGYTVVEVTDQAVYWHCLSDQTRLPKQTSWQRTTLTSLSFGTS